MRRQSFSADARVVSGVSCSLAHRAALLGLFLALAASAASSAAAQSLNDLLGGDSPLVPTAQVEPQITVSLVPQKSLAEGTPLTLAIQAEYGEDAYTYSQNASFGGATKITITEVYGLEAVDEEFTPNHPPKVVFEEAFGHEVEKFPGGVVWQRRYRLTGRVPADQVYLAGQVDYQVCDARTCRMLHQEFEVFPGDPVQAAEVGSESSAGAATESDAALAVSLPEAVTSTAERVDAPPALTYEIQSPGSQGSLPWYLGMAFLGGLILNVMPCVLPVLAIKVMSFVQQAGESRGRVLALNISYTLGVIGVFLVLASLAVTLKMSWGGLFQKPEFNLLMIGVVFAMALSLIGVFEVKLPGAIGAVGGQHREGLLGAFLTGIFATFLATPCTAPVMGTALTWSLRQEPAVVYLVWGVMGLGMASPYLLVAMVPSIARLLPRPGDWMIRFKEFSGILLMGAVVWLLRGLEHEVLVPILFVLVGVAVALWMIGSLYGHASSSLRKWIVRGLSLALLLLVGFFGSRQYQAGLERAEITREHMRELAALSADGGTSVVAIEDSETQAVSAELPWEPFSTARLETLLRAGHPVLVDFSATWCANCKVNEAVALNTLETAQFVREHGITTLYADYTREDPEIKRWLDRFNAIGIPLTVIFPARDPHQPVVPIILDGLFSQSKLLASLKNAVTSQVAVQERQAALIPRTSR